jgi:hypothetical protein
MISWTLVLGFRIHQFRFEKRSLTTKINLPLFLQQSKIRAPLRKAKRKVCCTAWTTTILGSWHVKFRAAFACPLFLQTHRACRMQSSEADGASQRGKRKGRNIPARAHYGRCSRFAFTAGGPLLQVNFAIESTPFALRTCTVSWLQGCSCFVQLHEDSGRGMQTCGLMGSSKWKRRSLA